MMSKEESGDHAEIFESNRRSWDAIVPVHQAHKQDQAAWMREGGDPLFPEEVELAGDVEGRSLLHLQCNCGQDSLGWARRGAEVTGVDLSGQAIEEARALSQDSGIAAVFETAEIHGWLESTERRFELAVGTYGALPWVPDLGRWLRGVHRVLQPGGALVVVDFHPLIWSLGPGTDASDWLRGDDYFEEGPIEERDGVGDYIGPELAPSGFVPRASEFRNPEAAWCFQHTMADLVLELGRSGFAIEDLREWPHANGCKVHPGLEAAEGRRYVLPKGRARVPMMLGLRVRKV